MPRLRALRHAILLPQGDATLFAWGLLLCAAYYACGLLGLSTPQIGNNVSLIWPPAGLAFAALLRLGPRLWPAVALAALLVALSTGAPLWTATLLALGNGGAMALAAATLRRFGMHPALDRRHDLRLLALGAVGAAALTASNGVFWLILGGALPLSAATRAWAYWWLGDLMGVIVVGVPLLTISRHTLARLLSPGLRSAALAAGTLLSTWLAFRGEAGGVSPLLFLPYLLLGWLALRTGVFTASVTMLLTAAIAVGATIAAQGPFAQAAPTASLAMLAGYLATLAAMPLLVTALTGELGSTEQRWQLALAASQLGVADWDLHAGEIEFSSRWHALLDEPALPSQEPAQGFWSRLHDDDRASVQVALASLRDAQSEAARAECRMRRSDGSWRWFELNALAAERDPAGEPLRLVATLRDVHGEREANAREQAADGLYRQLQERMARQAHYDEVTRLPNRAKLALLLQEALATSQREGSLLTVCHLDVDHFKAINERYGHGTGDRLMALLAARVQASLRSWAGGDDGAARVGGDEFALLLRTATLRESHHAVERVLRQIAQPCDIGLAEGPITVTASIGATVYPYDRVDGDALLRHADQAMYGAKQAGRDGYLFFDAEQDRRTKDRFVALGRVQEALDASEFALHYQPRVDMKRGRVLGAEALLRWLHPEHGLVGPSQFLPLVEHTGLGVALGRWVLGQGVAQLAAWLREGLDIKLSINVSARHLQEPSFVDELAALLARHGEAVAEHLVLEVLETAALADVDYTCELMQRCRELGVRFALDDFGTGYSTFTYLKRLPLDQLKIDRSFVQQMLEDRQDQAIVEGVIALAHTFACEVVAEGVETPAQAARLVELGCHAGQGNGIAAAMPAEQMPGWVRSFAGVPTATA
ncbi:MAG TPA: EAL domain-containing protein [Piscinibacter sp.]|nr:EAL domain-containing protein [Piscinibacter sp.]